MKKILFKQIMSFVEMELKNNSDSRDNDGLLCSIIWYKQYESIKHTFSDADNYITFLRRLINGELYAAESITRARRKIQELNPELRGRNYIQRKKRQQEVKDYIRRTDYLNK